MSKYIITEIDDVEKYRHQLIRFWDKHLLQNSTDIRFDWLYKNNPEGPPSTWLVFNEDQKEFIACGSFYPSVFFCNGEPIRVAIPIDFFVEKRYRVFGPAVEIQRTIVAAFQKRGLEVAFVAPNKQALGVFIKVGYKHVGQAKNWVRINKTQEWVFRYITFKIMAKFIARVLDIILSLKDIALYRNDYNNYYTSIVNYCTVAFDELWNRERIHFNIITNKSSEYLNWYYSSNTTNEYKFFCLHEKKDSTLRGFIVFFRDNDEIIISDIFPPDHRWLKPLLWYFIKFMKLESVKAVRLSFFGNDEFKKTIKEFGFIQREHERDYCFFFSKDISDKYISRLQGNSPTYLFIS